MSRHLIHGPAKCTEPHRHERTQCKIQKGSLCCSGSLRVKTLTFLTGMVSLFTLKYTSQQTKGSTKWHKVKKGTGSFPGDLRCSQPDRVIRVSKSRRRGDLPNMGKLHDSDFMPKMTALPPGSHHLEYRSDQKVQSESDS